MKYVKLIAKPGHWFKPNSEAFVESGMAIRRPTVDEWEIIKKEGGGVFCGTIVIDENKLTNYGPLGYKIGDERQDEEWCPPCEFNAEIVEKPFSKRKEECKVNITRFRDDSGYPTCAMDFQTGDVCMFYRTQSFGCKETCALFASGESLRRRKNGMGSLIPDGDCCIVWHYQYAAEKSRAIK